MSLIRYIVNGLNQDLRFGPNMDDLKLFFCKNFYSEKI